MTSKEDFVSRLVCTYAIFFELVFSMTASRECHVSRVFSAFMRKATHISAGEDSVLQTEKTEKNGAHFGHFLGKSSFSMTATPGKIVSQRAQTQGVDDMVADIKKTLGEGAREIQWWSI